MKMSYEGVISQLKAYGAVTHNGTFHADDIISAALLELFLVFDDGIGQKTPLDLRRVPNVDPEEKGFVFDIGRGKFDHHQEDALIRVSTNLHDDMALVDHPNTLITKYCAAGLIWRAYGVDFLRAAYKKLITVNVPSDDLLQPAFRNIDKFIETIDFVDNNGPRKFYNPLAYLIGCGNNQLYFKDSDEEFYIMKNAIIALLLPTISKEIENVKLAVYAKNIASATTKKYVILDENLFIPTYLFEGTQIQFVISRSIRDTSQWNLNAVNPYKINVENKDALEGCTFVHVGKFIAVFNSCDNAIKAAESLTL